jgi:hypothetical protein
MHTDAFFTSHGTAYIQVFAVYLAMQVSAEDSV